MALALPAFSAPSTTRSRSRLVAVALVAGLALAAYGAVLALALGDDGSVCGDGESLRLPGQPLACVHPDEAPPGVDVTDRVSTSELQAREGAGARAYAAAEDLGTPGAYASNASAPEVPCDGDGASGYRIQAMYVVEASKANRFASLQSTFKLWAAGVDDVINRSAALSGGVRHLRYVTDTNGSTCTAKVLNITVPDGSMANFSATINAVRSLGYDSPTRKYLMWTDTNSLCGIATMYQNSSDGQGNPNNGSYAQYARVDNGCWGFGDGASQHSVEAHELVHNLGGVQSAAPYATTNGHCWDESDTMCYADGGGHAMVQVCPTSNEYLLDCNLNDYFSTYPDPGGYLDTHWNAADSQFLLGGGNGTGGGSAGAPTVLGGTMAVNNPAVAGLPTQASVTPALPTGRTLTSAAWKSARTDCTFSTPTAVQTDVTCNASNTAATTVTVTLTDSSGATKAITSPLTFSTETGRPTTVSLSYDGQSDGTAAVCTSLASPLVGTVTDTATGLPVKGLTVAFTRQASTATTPSASGTKVTLADGTGTTSFATTATTTLRASTAALKAFAASNVANSVATPGTCTPNVAGSKDTSASYAGDVVTATGTLTRTVDGATVPIGSQTISVTQEVGTRIVNLGSAITRADGSWTASVKPTVSGPLSATLAANAAWAKTTGSLGALTVTQPETRLTGAADRSAVAYGQTVTVTGSLIRVAGADERPLGKTAIAVMLTAPGKSPVQVGAGTTLVDGTYSVAATPKTGGVLTVTYAGSTVQPAASAGLGSVTVSNWTPALDLSPSSSAVTAGTLVTFNGTVTRTWNTTTEAAKSLKVSLFFTPTGGTPSVVTSGITSLTGTFAIKYTPKSTGTWSAQIVNVAGHDNAASSPATVVVN